MDFREAFQVGRGLRHGFEALKRQPVGLLLGSALLLLTGGGTGSGPNVPSGGTGEDLDWGDLSGLSGQEFETIKGLFTGMSLAVLAGVIGCVVLLLLATWLFRSWVQVGYIRLQRDLVVDGSGSVGTLFSGGSQMWSMALWKLLSSVIVLGVTVVALLPGGLMLAWGFIDGEPSVAVTVAASTIMLLLVVPISIYVRLGVSLGNQAVVLEDCRPLDALDRSWNLVAGHRADLLVFFILTWLPNLLGCLLFCVGWFATAAVRHVAITESYLLATRDDAGDFAFSKLDTVDLPPATLS